MRRTDAIVSFDIPFLGGSTTRTSASASTDEASAQMKVTLSMPFNLALFRAFSTASGTISVAVTFSKFRARQRLIVPAPQ